MQSVLHYAMSPMTLKANRLEYIYACVGSVDFVAYLVFYSSVFILVLHIQ